MDAIQSVIKCGLACAGLLLALPANAQPTPTEPLERLLPVEGQVYQGQEQAWTFTATNGEVLSFFVKDISGGFDPVLTILDGDGSVLIANDDYNQPSNGDALLEAVTIPRTGTYTAVVSGFGGEAGVYRLTLLPGFSQVGASDNFNGSILWEALDDPLRVEAADGELALALEGARLRGIAVETGSPALAHYFAQTNVTVSGGQDGWIVGMAARLQDNNQYYILNVNSSGEWRFVLHLADGDRLLRDWTPHPALVPNKASFSLGMMVNGSGYDFFYDNQLFGRVSDTSLGSEGAFGLAVETQGSPTSQTTARFDDLVVTIPTLVNNQPIMPEQLVVGAPGDMVQELQRRRLIPGGGEMALTVDESFVESRRPGVERLMLGRGVTYFNFAIGTRVTWQSASPGVTGCGLVLRQQDDTHYTLAYLDQTGGYGLSQRAGEAFQPGIFGETPNFQAGTHHLLVIARGDILYYYVDGKYRGTLENEAVEGMIGEAVVNFEPISTSCTFSETWLWRWDEN